MLINTLPFVARRVLRLIAERQMLSTVLLKREIESIDDLNPALSALLQRRLIEAVRQSYRITQAGLECAGVTPSTTPPKNNIAVKARTNANTIAHLGSRSLPSINTAGGWDKTKAPICNASTKEPYMGAELRPFAGRLGAMSAYDLPSRTGQARRWPDGRVTALAGEQVTT